MFLSLTNIFKTLAIILVPVMLFTACESDDDDNNITNPTPQEMSYVRVAHLSPDAPAVDVWVDDNLVLEDVTYEAFSSYLELAAGDHNIKVVAANTTEPAVIDANVSLLEDVHYTVAATGLLNGSGNNAIAPIVLTDNRTIDQNNAKVRFVHTGSDAPAVSIYAVGGDTPLFENISFRGVGNYLSVPAGAVALEVRTASGDDLVLRFGDINLSAGTNYTVFAKGLLAPGNTNNDLGALATVDAPGSGATTVPLVAVGVDFSMLRVGHLAPDAPEVDVYLDNMLVLEDVPYLAFSNYLMVESGDYNIKVTPANDPNTAVIDANATLASNMNYTVAAVGQLADNSLAPAIYTEDLTAVGNAKVRFIHASANAPAVDLALREGSVLFSSIEFPNAGEYLEVAGGTYDFDVLLAGTDEPALYVDDVPLTDGTIYSVFAVGLAGNETTPLSAVAVIDNAQAGSQVVPLNTSAPSSAQLRIGHLAPDAPNVDIYINEMMAASNVPYKAFSQYMDVLADRNTQIQVYAAGTNTNPVIDATLTFDADMAYTVAATGLIGDGTFGPIVLNDTRNTDNSNASVRFAHTSPGAPAVDITTTDGTVLFGNTSFNEASDYAQIAAGTYELQVRAANTETVVLGFADVPLMNGTNYTVFATGQLSEGTLGAIAVVDAPGEGNTVVELEIAMAGLRIGHLSPDAPNVDVWVNGEGVAWDVPFKTFSSYLMVNAGPDVMIQVFAAGTMSDPVIDAALSFEANTYTTIAATGLIGNGSFGPIVLNDDLNTTGDARVRFLHASPDAPNVDITLTNGSVLFGNIMFNEAADYASVAAGGYDLQVRVSGSETVVISFGDVTLDAASNYTVIATGLAGDGTLGAMALIDAPGDGSTTAELMPAMSEVRVGHLSPDAPNVDVYVDGGLLLADVPFGAVSDYVQTTAASHNIEVYVSGTTMNPVINATLTLLPGEAYSVIATGLANLDDLSPMVLIDDRTPAMNGDAHVRFVHASPDAPMVDVQVAGGSPVLFDDVSFREFDGYTPVGAGTYDLEVALSENGAVALPVNGLTLNGSTNYTVFAIGLAGDGSLSALPVVDTP